MKLSSAIAAKILTTLYGSTGATQNLADDLGGVNRRNVQRWLSAEGDMPEGAARDLLRLVEGRLADLSSIRDELKRSLGQI